MATLEIIKEFPDFKYPGPRYKRFGENSGEKFRTECFIPWLDMHIDEKIILDINGFVAYPPSFFKEFILVTAEDLKYKTMIATMQIKCSNSAFQKKIEHILEEIK